MSDTSSRNPPGAPKFLADALLRSVSGASAFLKVASPTSASAQAELGIAAASFGEVEISPVVLRKLRPSFQEGEQAAWELLVSATSVGRQLATLNVASAQALFGRAFGVTLGEQAYLIESVSSNEAFGQVYLYRLLLREARQQAT